MTKILFGIARDLYVVLLIVLALEQLQGSDLLHDPTRKGVIGVTVIIACGKLTQFFFLDDSTRGRPGAPTRGPDRRKKTEGGKSCHLAWATSEMQGWRPAMEDMTCAVASLGKPLSGQALFAVFDGHGGSAVSLIASNEFPKVLTSCADSLLQAECANGGGSKAEAASERSGSFPPQLSVKALHETMLKVDSLIFKGGVGITPKGKGGPLGALASQMEGDVRKNAYNYVGSTAIVAMLDCGDGAGGSKNGNAPRQPQRVVVANCGDSRAVLCRAGKAVALSEDHKPELLHEEARIRRAGGHVARAGPCHRVDGSGLNLSRALGDFHYKARTDLPPEAQKITAVPEIRTLELTGEDEFLVLGCDGIFELHSSQDVVDIVSRGLKSGLSVDKVVEELVDKSCSSDLVKTKGRGGDNCSAIVVLLNPDGGRVNGR